MSHSEPLRWLRQLASVATRLPFARPPSPYFSRRSSDGELTLETALPSIAAKVRSLIQEFYDDHYFASDLGFLCVDGNGDFGSNPEKELERRVNKPHLWLAEPKTWSLPDLCDLVEVFHDLAARPTKGSHHSFADCGWHPSAFDRSSGRAFYRWRMNQLLDQTIFGLRLAESGEDVGRMVQVSSEGLVHLIDDVLESDGGASGEVRHAIAGFRGRSATREEQRSSVVSLAGVLEMRREILSENLLTKDENSLFEIANRFDLRHRRADQYSDYGTEFLEWIFYWYLATVQLIDRLFEREHAEISAVEME